jgi:hypothetical protein
MSWMQFVASIVGSLAWPLVVIAFLVLVRRQLAGLMERIQEVTVPGGGKAVFEKRLEMVRRQATAVVLEASANPASGENINGSDESVLEMANAIPQHLITAAYADIEKALVKVRPNLRKVRDGSIEDVVGYLYGRGVISRTMRTLFEELAATKKYVMSSQNAIIEPHEAVEYYQLSRVFLFRLNTLLANWEKQKEAAGEGED